MPPRTTKRKDNNKFKSKKQPELTENRTVWKPDNQGVKEETLTQTGRRGGDRQPGGEDARWCLADWAVPYLCADKRGGMTGEGDRPHNAGFQHKEIKPQSL